MSVFRDLVEGECSQPNAMGSFMQGFTSDKNGLYHDRWEGGEHQIFEDEEYDEPHLDNVFHRGGGDEDINLMMDRNLNFRDQDDFQQQHQPPVSHVAEQLQRFFQDFIMSTKEKHLMQTIPLDDIGLSHEDKFKIKNRTEVLFRHISEDDRGFTNDQLNRLFDSLDINPEQMVDKQFEDFDQHWKSNDWENDYHRTTTTTTNTGYLEDPYRNDVPHEIIPEVGEDFAHAWEEADHQEDYENAWFEEDEGGFDPFESAWEQGYDDKSVDAAWDETARKTLSDITRPITQINDPKLKNSKFMKFMNQLNTGESTIVDNEVVHNPNFQKEHHEDVQQWTDDYESFHEHATADRLAEYQFTIDQINEQDTLERGLDLFNEGLISDAIASLESEVKRNPDNSTAWMYLGLAHAENDQDGNAIICLSKCLQLDPQNPKARIALAVSYTNDYQKEKALDTLEDWLRINPDYSHILRHRPPMDTDNPYVDTWKRHNMTSDLFLEAARTKPNNPDPEVQTALGLLYNMSYEYEKAVDCFKVALQHSPQDYQLWNKLGATLANSNKSQEALGAYFKALEQKPTYVRARSNLGISYLSLNMYREAAQTFLGAISIHPESTHIWDNLKMVFRLMNREDLVQKINLNTRDINQFTDEFPL
ncbi:hypothetical protein CYY_001595 [Polysphondylium violaceum]|uniref:Peroxin-5 n=1 Tax=Polysphondylium violaceum TaxID=133409 RepID=A0A8J4UW19_9MYCE|nr:hypothetical protein CYY_001595 [Polysphondylium violaceum]